MGGQVAGGMALMVVGILLLTDRLRWFGRLHVSTSDWPFIVIAFGLFRLMYPAERRGRPPSRRFGAWLLYLGSWGLLNEFAVLGFEYRDSWPLLVIGFGLNIVWQALEPRPAGFPRSGHHEH